MSLNPHPNIIETAEAYKGYRGHLAIRADFLVDSILEELDRLAKLPHPPTTNDLRPHRFSGIRDIREPYYRVLVSTLTDYIIGSKWPALVLDLAATRVFYDYVFTGSPTLARAAAPATVPLLWPLTMLICKMEALTSGQVLAKVLAVKSRAYAGIARLISLVDEHPREYLGNKVLGLPLAESICVLLTVARFQTNGNYDQQTVRRVLSYGFFLADNHANRQIWFDTHRFDRSLQFSQDETDTLFENLGTEAIECITSVLVDWLEKHTTGDEKHEDGYQMAIPLLWCIGTHSIPFRDAFWERLAIPLANHWRSRKADCVPLAARSYALLILSRALKGTWAGAQSKKACATLAALDIASMVSQLCYLSVCLECPLRTFQTFIGAFSKWIENDPSLSKHLQGVIRPSVEPIYLSSLDKMGLASFALPVDTTDDDTDEDSDSGGALSGINCWVQFGTALGLDEAELREKRREKKSKVSLGLLGCSWERCPLFHLESEWPMLLCSDCFRAQYCVDSTCQKRDWHEGGHKATCSEAV